MDTLARDLMERLELDKRLRAVEQAVAGQDSTLKSILVETRAMESRLTAAVEAAKPKVWPAVSSLTAVVALLLVLAQSIYGPTS